MNIFTLCETISAVNWKPNWCHFPNVMKQPKVKHSNIHKHKNTHSVPSVAFATVQHFTKHLFVSMSNKKWITEHGNKKKFDLSVKNGNTFNDNLRQRVVLTAEIQSNLVENHIEIYRKNMMSRRSSKYRTSNELWLLRYTSKKILRKKKHNLQDQFIG